MDRYTSGAGDSVGSPGALYDFGMRMHASIVHYALHKGKCLLHSSSGYANYMSDTPGERLKEARIKAGFGTVAEAAKALGVNPNTYVQHENGIRGVPKTKAPLYARRFKVAVDWLLYGSGSSEAPMVSGGAGGSWQPRADIMESIVAVALLPFPRARVSANDLPIFAHAVTEAVKYVATDPTRADKPGFRDAVEAIVETAVRSYRPPNGQAA